MTQMRKFEQEAIATEIYQKIQATNGVVQKELEQTKAYKDLQSVIDELSILEKRRQGIAETISETRNTLGESVKQFNEKISQNNFELTTTGMYYDKVGQLSWTDNEWTLKQNIERKLAIALISPDWKDKLSSIIDDIANQFGA